MENIYGIYEGIVVNNQDEFNLGRLQVKVISPALSSNDNDESMPWATPCMPFGGNESIQMVYVPPIGSKVWVGYIKGNSVSPIILGYQRKTTKTLKIDYSKYYGKRDNSLLYWKFGSADGAPSLKFDSIANKLEIGSDTYGETRLSQCSDGNAGLKMQTSQSVLSFAPSSSYAVLNNNGSAFTTNGNYKESIVGKRVTLIGESIIKKVGNPAISEMLSIAGTHSKYETLKLAIGDNLYSIIINLLLEPGYLIEKTLYQNLLLKYQLNPSTLSEAVQTVPQDSKELLGKIFDLKGNAESLYALFDSGPEGIDHILKASKNKEEEKVLGTNIKDNLVVEGSRQAKIFGNDNTIILKNKSEQIMTGKWQVTLANGGLEWKVFGDSGLMLVNGDYNFVLGKGDFNTTFALHTNKAVFKHSISTMTDRLTKKTAFDDLYDFVYALAQHYMSHTHIATAPGSPTTPPTMPNPFFPTYMLNEAQSKAKKNSPSIANPYYTGNLEAD